MATKLVSSTVGGGSIELSPEEFTHLSADKNYSALLLVTYNYRAV